jgi:predicted nuclease of predicted toxin-antitoxin system
MAGVGNYPAHRANTGMKFLLDMGISPTVGAFLKEQGYESVHLIDEGLDELEDSQILQKARLTHSVLLTHDLDFGDLLAASGETLPSVIIFRLRNMRPEQLIQKLKDALPQCQGALKKGAVISLDETSLRVRLLPIKTTE